MPAHAFHDRATLKARLTGIGLLLLAANAAAWLWAFAAFRGFPLLLGTAFLAYSLGLRHAVDADHIAAIDNVTRKLMQQGRQPVAVGLLFSLGHSTVVVLGSLALALAASLLQSRLQTIHSVGGLVGTLVSTLFLFAIALANLMVLRSIWASFRRVRAGLPYQEEDLDLLMAGGGLMARILRPLFGLIRKSWHMYPLGVLFGLGFDTATEIGLLGISATQASRGLSLGAILVFPALFAAGMSLIDTADNLLMLGAYGWAFVKPVRKLYYNLTITAVSVVVALAVGGLEALGLMANHFEPAGIFWDAIRSLNEHFGLLGYCILILFVLSWILSLAIYKWRRFDELELAAQPPEAEG